MTGLPIFVLSLLLPLSVIAESSPPPRTFAQQMEALEERNGGIIGVSAFNSANGDRLSYRAGTRFALCSVHKLVLVAAVLARIDSGEEDLNRVVNFSASDIQEYAPIVKKHLEAGKIRIDELNAAAIKYSDNSASNLLLASIGGPLSFTTYARSLGDRVTRLDRAEPELNSNLPGDIRDTTTPAAMLHTMHRILIGNALKPTSREYLHTLLIENTTGDKKLRAGLEPTWRVGDKTGSGENGASNDVAIVWPTGREPFLVAVFYTGAEGDADKKSAVIAEAGRIVSSTLYPTQ